MYQSPQSSNDPTIPSFQPIAPSPPIKPPRKKMRRGCLISLIVAAVLVVAFIALGLYGETLPPVPSAAATATSAPTQARIQPTHPSHPTAKPTHAPTPTPRPVQYPPKTKADLMALARLGDARAIHEFHSESVGLTGACPQPKRLVTVDPSITGQKLAEDLLAYFYANQLDSPCGSIVFAYHTQDESNGDGYTAGRIQFDATDASGQENVDPNATNLKHTLTLDVGGLFTSQQESVVTY